MVGTIGFQLAKNRKIVGFGYHPKHVSIKHIGNGVLRNIAGTATKALGNFLVNRLSSAISGSGRRTHRKRTIGASYRLSGQGVKSRKPKSVNNKKKPS